MTPAELRAARRELGLNQQQMAQTLKTHRRTYQDWEHGLNPIPGICEVAVQLLVQKDRWVMQAIKEKLALVGKKPL